MSHVHYPRVAIVGAGIAGLNAALTLQDAGLSCTLYESSHFIGGRMHSDTTTWDDGMVTEWCGELIDSEHETIRRLATRFGLQLIDMGEHIADRAQTTMYYCDRYYDAQEFARDFRVLIPTLKQHYQAVDFPTTHTRFTETAYQLDHISVHDWIEQYVEGGHAKPLGRMLDRGCTGFYGLDTQQQSALNLVYMYGPHTINDKSDFSKGSLNGNAKIAGGNQQLPHAIAATLPEECIQLDHRLVAIKRGKDDSITLSFATPEGVTEAQYDTVILTLPFSTLRHIDYRQAGFDALKQIAISELGYGTISKLFLQFDTRYWYQEGPWPGINSGFILTDLDISVLWDTSLGQTGRHGLLVDYTGGTIGASYSPEAPYSTSNDSERVQQYAQHCVQQLEHVFPGISIHYTGKAALSYPTGNPHALGSYSCWRVGQYTLFAGYEGVRQGPIHFAGEHCSTEWQGYMEGAAKEGERAAQEIVQEYR